MIFQQMKLGTNVIPHFHVILTGQFICCIICMIQGHLQGQKVKYQGQLRKITVYNKKKLGTCVIPHAILTGSSISDIILIIQGHLQGQRGQFQGEVRQNIIFNK